LARAYGDPPELLPVSFALLMHILNDTFFSTVLKGICLYIILFHLHATKTVTIAAKVG
jgi:hypothetical protein